MDEDKNKTATSGVNNVLSGIGIFILGIPLAFFLIGPGVISDFGPGETWLKRALIMSMIVIIGYGLLGYILGKIKPTMSWKSGFLLSLFPILGSIFAIINILRGFSSYSSFDPQGLFIFLPVIVAIVVGPLSSYWGSRSRKTWQGKFFKVILIIILAVAVLLVGYFLIRVFLTQPMNAESVLQPVP